MGKWIYMENFVPEQRNTVTMAVTLTPRQSRAAELRKNYPDKIPVILLKKDESTPPLRKTQFLCPLSLTFGKFTFIIREYCTTKASSHQGIFYSVGNRVLTSGFTIGEIDSHMRASDGFLYITYGFENVFG